MPDVLTDNAEFILKKRYYRKDENGNVIEDWPKLCRRVASEVAKAEKNEEDQKKWANIFYESLYNLDFLPNSPALKGAGGSNQYFACFVLPIHDSRTSIFRESLADAVDIQAFGGGVGFNFSSLRPRGSLIKSTGGQSSGPISFMKIYDFTFADVIKQGGLRPGASMGILNIEHPDILDFIKCKTEEGQISGFNISVGISKEFMKAVEEDKEWALKWDGKVLRTIRAKELWDRIAKQAWTNGEPGVLYFDNINKDNPFPNIPIEATNPCCFSINSDVFVITKNGIKEIKKVTSEDLVWIDSVKEWVKTSGYFQVGVHDVYKVVFSNGEDFFVTLNHKFEKIVENNGEVSTQLVEVEDLKPGDKILVLTNTPDISFSNYGTSEEGFTLGWLTINENSKADWVANRLIESYQLNKNNNFFIFNMSKEFIAGYISAIFSARGHVTNIRDFVSDKLIQRIQLDSFDKNVIQQVKNLLLLFGIRSSLRNLENEGFYILVIQGSEDITKFYNLIKHKTNEFSDKLQDLEYMINHDLNDYENINTNYTEVVSIEKVGQSTVGCIEVPKYHKFVANGIISGNSESPLNYYEACCLGSINLFNCLKQVNGKWDIDLDKLEKVVKIGVRFLDDMIDVNVFPVKNIELITKKHRKIGLGVMGWADLLLRMGVKYDTDEAIVLADYLMSHMRKFADLATEELGKEKGPFPDIDKSIYKGKTRRNSTVLSIAPTGCQKYDTLVITDRGILRLEELIDKESLVKWQSLGCNVAQEKNQALATRGFNNGFTNTKKIILKSNIELECTPNHQYRVFDFYKKDYIWKRADHLQAGDCLAIRIGGYFNKLEPSLVPVDDKYHNLNFPSSMSPELAKLVGILYNCGLVFGKDIGIYLNRHDEELTYVIVDLLKNLFDMRTEIIAGNIRSLNYTKAQSLKEWLKKNQLLYNSKEIPYIIRHSSSESIKNFIEGLYLGSATEGVIATLSSRVAQDIAICMRSIGLYSYIETEIEPTVEDGLIKYFVYQANNLKEEPLCKNIGQDIYFDEVKEIQDSICLTLDLEVPENNTYISNSVISHNTLSTIANVNGGIEPYFSWEYEANRVGGTLVYTYPQVVQEYMQTYNISSINQLPSFFVTSEQVPPMFHVRMAAAFQRHVDLGISKTLNLPNSATVDDVRDTFEMAYRLGCKGVTVYRKGSREFEMLVDKQHKKEKESKNLRYKPPKEVLYQMYASKDVGGEGMSVALIGDYFGVSASTVWRWLRTYNIETRSISEGLKQRITREEYVVNLPKIAKELIIAGLLGRGELVPTDGKNYYFKMESNNRDYLVWVAYSLESSGLRQLGVIGDETPYTYKSIATSDLADLYEEWYPNGKLRVPDNFDFTPYILNNLYLERSFTDSNGNLHFIFPKFDAENLNKLAQKMKALKFKITVKEGDIVILKKDKDNFEDYMDSNGDRVPDFSSPFRLPRTPKKRPSDLNGVTPRVKTGCGNMYVTVNMDEQGPFEVFSLLGKAGGCSACNLEAISRLVSLCLRSGVNVKDIIKDLKNISCPKQAFDRGGVILSCPDALGKVLEGVSNQYVEDKMRGSAGVCPECGNTLDTTEKCPKCLECGWTRC